jgi:hypothetical protein
MKQVASRITMAGDALPRQCRRGGTTVLEIVISFTLLSTVLVFATPLVVRHGRLLAAQRHYRLALDELSNQFERLSELSAEELPAAIERLAPSAYAAARLPGAELHGELDAAEMGQRITLRLYWDEPGRRAAPVKLAGWVIPGSEKARRGAGEEGP